MVREAMRASQIRKTRSLVSLELPNLTLYSTRTRTPSDRDERCFSKKRRLHDPSTWTRWDVRWRTCLRRCTRWAGSRSHASRKRKTWWSVWSRRTWSAYSSRRRKWRRGGRGRRTRCSTRASTTWTTSGDSRTYSVKEEVTNRKMTRRCTGRIISSKRIYKSMSREGITTRALKDRIREARNSTKTNRCVPGTGRLNKRSSIREDDCQFN